MVVMVLVLIMVKAEAVVLVQLAQMLDHQILHLELEEPVLMLQIVL
jgi:hypothetical protein